MTSSTEFKPTDPFGNLEKLMEQFKAAGVDMSEVVESRRQDMETLVAANAASYESMQALGKKQIDILTQAMESAQQAVKSMASGSTPDPAKQAQLAQAAYEKAVADMKEMAEMASAAQQEITDSISVRAKESLKEIEALIRQK